MDKLFLRLPATSANLGPGFDALGLALQLFLEIRAEVSSRFQILATGRNADLVGRLDGNLMLNTYRALAPHGPALSLQVSNGIPLGMGCGSSAAALVAGVSLANHFGELGWNSQQVLEESCRREGHPDNVAACLLGGLTASSMDVSTGQVTVATFVDQHPDWRLLLALPSASLATEKARALLPAAYSRADAVANIQATALLMAAFAQNRPDLLRAGTQDWIHQPCRLQACPLLAALLPLAGHAGVYSVTLSGAGPSVLLITSSAVSAEDLTQRIRAAAGGSTLEVVTTAIAGPAEVTSGLVTID